MLTQQSSPHIKPPLHVSDIMFSVIWALIPGILVMFWLYGWSVIINLVLCTVFALAFEAFSLYLRNRPIKVYLQDYSAVITALLLALSLPTLVPWWIVFLGALFAIVLSKQVYGGLGNNVFNPAMVAYAILLIAFPEQMSGLWQQTSIEVFPPQLGLFETLHYQLSNQLPSNLNIDALTSATPLDQVKTAINAGTASIAELKTQATVYGFFGGYAVEWINLAFLAGGVWMIYKGIISWHIPLSFLLTLSVLSLLLGYGYDSDANPSPLFHLFSGATMLGAFFIATDPVTCATTPKGRLVFGAGIGVLVYVIRTWGGYPDAIAFAVILMNICVPLIDYYTQPRVYGHQIDE